MFMKHPFPKVLTTIVLSMLALCVSAKNPYIQGAKFTFKVHSYTKNMAQYTNSTSDVTYYEDWVVTSYDPSTQESTIESTSRYSNWEPYKTYSSSEDGKRTFTIKPVDGRYVTVTSSGYSYFYSSSNQPSTSSIILFGKSWTAKVYGESSGGPSSVYAPDGTKITSDKESSYSNTWTDLGYVRSYSYSNNGNSNDRWIERFEKDLIYAYIPDPVNYPEIEYSTVKKPVTEFALVQYDPTYAMWPEGDGHINNANECLLFGWKKNDSFTGCDVYAVQLHSEEAWSMYKISKEFLGENTRLQQMDIDNDPYIDHVLMLSYLSQPRGVHLKQVMGGGDWLFFLAPYNEVRYNNEKFEEFAAWLNGGNFADWGEAFDALVDWYTTSPGTFPLWVNLDGSEVKTFGHAYNTTPTGIEEITSDQPSSCNVYAADNNIVIKGQYKSALVVGLDGKVIYRNESGSNNDNETQIPAPNDGMYIIKLDDKTFKLIVK